MTGAPHVSFWQRRVLNPVAAQFTQGFTPEKLALTAALGVAGGLFPFLGCTTALCALLALVFRLNQPVIHVVNQLLWPVQLPMIVVYVKAGARLCGAEPQAFALEEITRVFWNSQSEFWRRFGAMGAQALAAWLLSAPFLVAAIYFASRPFLRHLASKRAAQP